MILGICVASRARQDVGDVTLTVADMPAPAGQDGLVGSAGGSRADRPRRRKFTAAYKLEILAEYEKFTDPGERGALLRREGLYHSHVQQWREARDQGALQALTDKPAGRRAQGKADAEAQRLRKENERLAAELAKTKAALEIMRKACELVELLSESADSDPRSTK
jgi:transposase